ncbi:cytochrome D ubiquinol oxidase subunit II [Actinobacillus pleuropneumoniae]|nr:cytochrome D ubiquinol oxidase subunit II [Actinobacillus pleuropneumoniae]
MIDYEILRFIWWILIVVLLIGFCGYRRLRYGRINVIAGNR